MADGEAKPDVERAVDELYAGDPGDFLPARQRLVAELRGTGRREEARQVAGLRRPTLAAWAIDHLALEAPDRIDALVSAGERLRRAHEEVVSGGDPRALHQAAEERRALIAALAEEALEVLARRGGGHPDAHREEIEATLEAASSETEVAALARRGRLVTAAPRPAGFGGLLDLPLPTAPPQEAGAPIEVPEERDGRRDEEELERARQETRRLEQQAAEAAADAQRARSAVDQAVATVEELERELASARARAAAAREEARRARAREEEARAALAAAAGRLRRGEVGK
ncbi:MAG: hypothetical protein M3N68_09610 [Actinomycetota bacterium]|nr:hypothetical protein [Actinomycetota bacterium]